MKKVKTEFLIIICIFCFSLNAHSMKLFAKRDSSFLWRNCPEFAAGFDLGTGLLDVSKLHLNNLNKFSKIVFGARIYHKKVGFGFHQSILLSRNKNAGNANNMNISKGYIGKGNSSFFLSYLEYLGKGIFIEPAMFFGITFSQFNYVQREIKVFQSLL